MEEIEDAYKANIISEDASRLNDSRSEILTE